MIFTHLKKSDDACFEEYYLKVSELVTNIQATIFANPAFYRVRREFFGVISVVWLNDQKVSYIYDIHAVVVNGL